MTTKTDSIDQAARAMATSAPPGPILELSTRLVEVLDRVKELEDQRVHDRRIFDRELVSQRDAFRRATTEALGYRMELKALKTAQTPRPMSEAPNTIGDSVYLVAKVRWGRFHEYPDGYHDGWAGENGHEWALGGISGWLPLPDQGKDSP